MLKSSGREQSSSIFSLILRVDYYFLNKNESHENRQSWPVQTGPGRSLPVQNFREHPHVREHARVFFGNMLFLLKKFGGPAKTGNF